MKTIDIRRGYQDNRFILQYIVSIIATIMDKLAAIRAFVSVAEEGGFSAAAQELGVSKSAASRQIAALEEVLGAQLLKRSTRTVRLTDSFVDPYDEGFDVTLRIGELEDSSLAARKLAQIEMGLFASPAYIERHGRPRGPDDLKSHWALHYGKPAAQVEWELRGGMTETVSIRYRLCSNNGNALRVAALAGLGIGLVPAFLMREDVQKGSLVTILDGFDPKPINLYAIYPPTRFLAAKVRVFIDFLAQRFSQARP